MTDRLKSSINKHPIDVLFELIDQQAEDEGLWFIAETAPEAYLQQELRKLHALIEDMFDSETSRKEGKINGT